MKLNVGDKVMISGNRPEQLVGHILIVNKVLGYNHYRFYHPTVDWVGKYTSMDIEEEFKVRHLNKLERILK